jgi:hypothetical protein
MMIINHNDNENFYGMIDLILVFFNKMNTLNIFFVLQHFFLMIRPLPRGIINKMKLDTRSYMIIVHQF